MYYIKYNNIDLTDLVKVREVEIPSLPTMEHSSIDVFERDGGIYNGMSYKTRDIRLTFIIQPEDPNDYEMYVQDVKRAFYTREEAPLYCGDEKLYIWCVPVDDLIITELGNGCAECEVNLVSYRPYWCSSEIQSIDSDVKTFTVENSGDLDTYPVIGVGISSDSTFVQLENKTTGEKVLLGSLPSVENTPTKSNETILHDPMESTSGWVQSDATIDAGRATGGTIAVNDAKEGLMCGDFGSATNGATWHGACYRKNLNTAVKNFKVRITMHHNSTGTSGDPSIKKPYSNDTSGSNTTTDSYYKVTANAGLRLRKEASTKSTILCTIPYGTKLTGTLSNGWLKTTYKSKTGYCYATYLKKYSGTGGDSTTQSNFVTAKSTAIRATASRTATNKKTIPVGKCIRCITSTKYPTGDKDKDKGKFYKLAKAYEGQTGYVWIDNLVKASDYQIVYDEEMYETSDDKTGVCTLYGFSADGTQLFSMSMIDDNNYYEFTYPLIRKNGEDFLKDKTVAPNPKIETVYNESGGELKAEKKYTLSGEYGDWNEFYGELYIERINDKWYSYVKKIKSGEVVKIIKSSTVTDKTNSDKTLSYVVMYIGTTDTAEKASGMSLNLVEVKQDMKSSTEDTSNKNWQEFEQGDMLIIDCGTPAVYLNDEESPNLIDVGSEFFRLVPGDNEIRLVTDDSKPITTVMFNKKYL